MIFNVTFLRFFFKSGKCWTVDFSTDGRFVATGSHTGELNIFSVDSDAQEHIGTMGKLTLSIAYVSA